MDNNGYGFSANEASSFLNCSAYANREGFLIGAGSVIRDCIAESTRGTAIRGDGSQISDCSILFTARHGIHVNGDCVVRNNVVSDSGTAFSGIDVPGSAIYVESSRNRIEGNNVTRSDVGIHVISTDNFITRNSARGNGTNYVITALNKVGTIVGAP
jgi:parallel beta-helix repeat protein